MRSKVNCNKLVSDFLNDYSISENDIAAGFAVNVRTIYDWAVGVPVSKDYHGKIDDFVAT